METWSKSLDFNSISEEFDTPLYLLSLKQLKTNFNEYLNIVGKPDNIAYPVKANPSITILRIISRLGGSVDCATINEIDLALSVGFPYNKIYYNTPAPDIYMAISLWENGSNIVFDSKEILFEFDNLCENNEEKRTGKLLARINPEYPIEYADKQDWQKMTAHSSSQSKFGIPSETLINILNNIRVPISGLHTHVGTLMDNVESFRNILEFLNQLADIINIQTHHKITDIDFGGGLGIAFHSHENYPLINQLKEALIGQFRKDINYIVEPGNSLVGNTIGLLTKVTAVKDMRNKRWAVVDVGSDQLSKITLSDWNHQILKTDHKPLPFEGKDSLGGPLCFAGDTLLHQTNLEGIEVGDTLFIQHCGAYCYAFSNNFNGFYYNGMCIINENNNILLCNTSEDPYLSSIYATQVLDNEYTLWEKPKELGTNKIRSLRSEYLSLGQKDDKYEILNITQLSKNRFDANVKVRSKVDFVSGPLAFSIAGDVSIVSILYLLKKEVKDISIWEDRFVLNSNEKIEPNRTITCQVLLSPIISMNNNNVLTARFSLDDAKFTGYCRVKFDINPNVA